MIFQCPQKQEKNAVNEQDRLTLKLSWTMGTDKITSPPPLGATPLLSIFKSSPSEGTPNSFKIGKVVDLKVSTDGSLGQLVIPETARFHSNIKL